MPVLFRMSGASQYTSLMADRLIAAAVLSVLVATSACSRTSASSSSPQNHLTSVVQRPQVQPSVAELSAVPSADTGLTPELRETLRQSESGNVAAMVKLATAYETGEGSPKDAQQAITWFTKAAEAGNSVAMYRLGRIYATDSGAERDYVEAFNWYQRAAAKGNSDAMYSLGAAYEHGQGVREDIQRAVNWYDEATLHGNKSAKVALDRLGESFDRKSVVAICHAPCRY